MPIEATSDGQAQQVSIQKIRPVTSIASPKNELLSGSQSLHCSQEKVMTVQADCQQLVKEAFINADALAIVVALVTEPLSSGIRMGEQDAQLVQLVITFVRNLLYIPDRLATAGEQP